MRQIVLKSVILALLMAFATAGPALAYIDPSVGGMLFQVLAMAFAVLSGILLLFSRQIRMGIARARRALRRPSDGQNQPAEDVPAHHPNPED